MKLRHPQYKIKATDTLSKITDIFGVEERIWKRYHNNMCTLDDIIGDNLPMHLKEIYLLPELWDKETDFNKSIIEIASDRSFQKIKLGYDNTLLMKFSPNSFTYKVSIKTDSNNQTNQIDYNVSIKWIQQEDLIHTIQINKLPETYKINGMEADLIADELAIKTASVLYPLELLVTYQDGIIGVNNVEEIQKRWINIKRNILDYNEGKIIEKYLRLTEKSIKDEQTLLFSLRNDWFVHAYFNDIYQTYTTKYETENQIKVPFIFNTDGVVYKVKQKINKDLDKEGCVNIALHGKPSDTRSIIDLESKLDYERYPSESPLIGNYDANYILDPEFNTINEVKINAELELSNSKIVDIHITKIKRIDYE